MSFAHINVDSFLPKSWDRTLGTRAFQFDAFVSHNKDDAHSLILTSLLVERGATVWHDNNADVRDRKVQERVTQALIRSRFVVVSIDEQFRDSAWVRSEYLPGLQVERQSNAKRIIVVKMGPGAVVPDDLSHQPCFMGYDELQMSELVNLLLAGNSIAGPLAVLNEVVDNYMVSEDEVSVRLKSVAEDPQIASVAYKTIRWLAEVALTPQDRRHPQALMAVRTAFIRGVDVAALSEQQRDCAVSAALLVCQLPSSDDRANGLYILLHLCKSNPSGPLTAVVLKMLATEPDDSIISLAFGWLDKQWADLPSSYKSLVEICALRDPTHLRLYYPRSVMIDDFSPPIRVRIFVRGLETDSLSDNERIHLIEDRVEYILQRQSSVGGESGVDVLRSVMGISDLEIVARDLDELLFHYDVPRDNSEVLAPRYVRLIQNVVAESQKSKGYPLLLMEEWVVDFLLIQLLWCATLPATSESARHVYNAICDLIETEGTLIDEVPKYRQALVDLREFKSKDQVQIL